MGVPGSGKTFVLQNLFALDSFTHLLDLDHAMRQHPLYDPNDRTKLYSSLSASSERKPKGTEAYRWADKKISEEYRDVITSEQDVRICVDGTGTNVPRTLERMRMAKENGFHVILVNVTCSRETILYRNSLRKRNVPKNVIDDYIYKLDGSVQATLNSLLVHQYIEMNNELETPMNFTAEIRAQIEKSNETQRAIFDYY